MHARKAASVFPEPVGAEISVVRPARMCGHPCSCGSVGVPNRETNHSATRGWAQARDAGRDCIRPFYSETRVSPTVRREVIPLLQPSWLGNTNLDGKMSPGVQPAIVDSFRSTSNMRG